MKKILLFAAVVLGFTAMQAQTTLTGSKFSDNWSLGLSGMGVTPLTHHAFWPNMRGGIGLDITKQITPVFGLGVEGNWYINTTKSKTVFDGSNISLLGKFNLMNAFAGYKGTPRDFEIEAVAGAGWLHNYGIVGNAFSTKYGLNFNFNLGEAKAWTVAFKPAIVWNMDRDASTNTYGNSTYNANHAFVELALGIVYHFNNSNGTHHFTIADLYSKSQIDELNAKINGLRGDLDQKDAALAAKQNELDQANARNNQLQNDLNDCINKAPQAVVKTTDTMESVVTFDQGKTIINKSQLPNVERVATYLKNHKDSKVVVKGYASPEGGAAINAKLAKERAEAVKTILVNKYKIKADRIAAEGQGVGNMFSEPDWNRVSICTLENQK